MDSAEIQEMLEEYEREGLVERTDEERDGHPVFRFTPEGRHAYIVERWSNLNDRELLAVFGALLAADGQPMLGADHDELQLDPLRDEIGALVEEVGEVVLHRGLTTWERRGPSSSEG
jgi:hypothetical protein